MNTMLDINEFLNQDEKKDMLRLLTAGSVDDGKSTLIGRLLFDSKKLYEDQLDALERDSKRVGNAGDNIDYALLLDGLKAEREQGITIDVAYRYFSTNKRKFIIADTPGHEQYTRNMITGGSTASLAIILVDAQTGVITQTRRHSFIVSLLGIKNVVLAVNKMDLVDFDQKVYDDIVAEYRSFTAALNIPNIYPIPLSALKGDNVVEKSDSTPWYDGVCLLDFLESVEVKSVNEYGYFRYPVQYVLRPDRNFRGFSGKVAAGVVRKGDEIMALPSGKRSRVKGIHVYEGEVEKAFPPQCVTLTLEDEIDISRGEMIVHPDSLPMIERRFEAMLVWLDEKEMDPKRQYFIKHTSNLTKASIEKIDYKVNINTLAHEESTGLRLNEIGKIRITSNKPLFFDPYQNNRATGAFILIDAVSNNTCGAGMIVDKIADSEQDTHLNDSQIKSVLAGNSLITPAERVERYGHKGAVVYATGAGDECYKLGFMLERRLFAEGFATLLLKAGDYTEADRNALIGAAARQGFVVLVLGAPNAGIKEIPAIELDAAGNAGLKEVVSLLNKL